MESTGEKWGDYFSKKGIKTVYTLTADSDRRTGGRVSENGAERKREILTSIRPSGKKGLSYQN